VTERKPAGVRFESWVERRIREALERGEFDDLPGAGKPLRGLTGQYDEMWWIKQVVERERISVLPPMLALRREAEDLLDSLAEVSSEASVRDLVADYNARVVEAIRRPQDGPLSAIPRRLEVDEVLAEWARRRAHS
jgi:Domain of unknown function (DUF1992)